jgi:hypothetical protein
LVVGLLGDHTADRLVLALLQQPQQLRLQVRAQIPDLVEKQGAFVGLLHQTFFFLPGAGESALDVAEEFALQHVRWDGGAVHGDELVRSAWAVLVDGPRHQFLAGAAGTGDQHRAHGGGHLADALEDGAHDRGGAHQGGKPVLLRQRQAQGQVLLHHGLPAHGLVHGDQDALLAEGLGDVVEGPLAGRLDGGLDGGEGRKDDDGRAGLGLLDLGEQGDAVHPGHLEVGDDALHRIFPEPLQGLERVALRCDHVVAVLRDHPPQQNEHVLFVVYDQYPSGHRSSSITASQSRLETNPPGPLFQRGSNKHLGLSPL